MRSTQRASCMNTRSSASLKTPKTCLCRKANSHYGSGFEHGLSGKKQVSHLKYAIKVEIDVAHLVTQINTSIGYTATHKEIYSVSRPHDTFSTAERKRCGIFTANTSDKSWNQDWSLVSILVTDLQRCEFSHARRQRHCFSPMAQISNSNWPNVWA